MACTQQSASVYLENARCDLVRRLQNLPLVTENLYQRKVFNDHEADAFKAEKTDFDRARFILDCVRKKGEEASYELLRILDITRKRTLHPDSHMWISCFPFREDDETDYSVGTKPCYNYQKQLKIKAKNILRRQWNQFSKHLKCNPQETFIPLVLHTDKDLSTAKNKVKLKNTKYKKLRPKKLRCYIPVQKWRLSPDDILDSHHRAVLLIGKPGIGKTTVVLKMLSIWSQKDDRTLDYMFYFDESTLSQTSDPVGLENFMFDVYAKPLEKDRKEVLQDIEENSENVIIIIDGINNLQNNQNLEMIVDRDFLPNAKIVLTCRSEEEDDFLFSDWPDCKVYVQGFSEDSIRTYLTQVMGSDSDLLNTVLNNQELFSLCHVPMYAAMVAETVSFQSSTEGSPKHPQTVTEMYVQIFRQDLKKAGKKTLDEVDNYMKDVRDQLCFLMKCAFDATMQKTVNIANVDCGKKEISQVFLKKITIEETLTSLEKFYAFLHNTVQEFFSALWLVMNESEIDGFLQLCLTKEKQHMKHVIPFLCGLQSEQNLKLLKSLYSQDQIKRASDELLIKVINILLQGQPDGHTDEVDEEDYDVDFVFMCQCLCESQSPEASLMFLEKVNYHLDLSEEELDPHQWCAVSYVISQSNKKQVDLSLGNCRISDSGIQMLLKITPNLRDKSSVLCHIWTSVLCCEIPRDYTTLLRACGREIHLPSVGKKCVFIKAGEIISQSLEKINLYLHCSSEQLSDDFCNMFFEGLPHLNSLSFAHSTACDVIIKFLLHLLNKAAKCERETGEQTLELLTSVCRHEGFPFNVTERNIQREFFLDLCLQTALHQSDTILITVENLVLPLFKNPDDQCVFLLDLYSHVKHYETETGRRVLPALQPLYQSAPAVWYINLSERKASLFLEVLTLHTVKKLVVLLDFSDEESEVRSFLQCLPHISQLRFVPHLIGNDEWRKQVKSFLLHLCLQAALHQRDNIQTTVEKLMSSSYEDKVNFLLDLYSHVKHYETETGRRVLPALQPLYQSALAFCFIDLSKRKASLFLEVLTLHTVKKPVELRGCSDEESVVRSFLQCLPHISQLSFTRLYGEEEDAIKFLLKLFVTALECDAATGESFTELLQSVCCYGSFPMGDVNYCSNEPDEQCDFLLDLYSHVKHYETETGRRVLPALQPLYQSAPAVWYINLSKRKASFFLEVLTLQTVKKPVMLRGCSVEESEVRSFLQCLPHISQLSFLIEEKEEEDNDIKFLLKLFVTALECDAATGERFTELLLSVCCYEFFPLDDESNSHHYQSYFLLGLYSHVKHYETETGRRVLPALQPLYQSAPADWYIDLSERKTSLFLEVLTLHTVKKPVVLSGCSDEDSEVRSFLQCLPHISQLRFYRLYGEKDNKIRFLLKLFVTALECDAATGESFTELLQSVCCYKSFPSVVDNYSAVAQCDFLLYLYSHVKHYETETGRRVLPALQPLYQSAPAVWNINLSERKTSLFLEVLTLHTVKKPVVLWGSTDEESEVRSFLQCLPHISQLRFIRLVGEKNEDKFKFLLKLFVTALECDAATGESFTELLLSVCCYGSFPLGDECYNSDPYYQSDFLLDLCSHVKHYETETGRRVLPALQPLYQSAPAVWYINLSERKASLFLEVLKLHTVKKPVVLSGYSDEESEVRSVLQCLPHISQLRFYRRYGVKEDKIKLLLKLFVTALECDAATGESFTELLQSVCCYESFPLGYDPDDQCDFLLDLYSHVKHYESETGRRVLPALQPLYQSAPAVWYINLSKRKASLFLEVLTLHTVKKPVKLRGCSDEESEVRSFLQCLPHISQLSGTEDCVPSLCKVAQTKELKYLLQVLDFTLSLRGVLLTSSCRAVGRLLKFSNSKLNLTLNPQVISLRGARILFRHIKHLHTLTLNGGLVVKMEQVLRTVRSPTAVNIEELSLIQKNTHKPEMALCRVLSSSASLLRFWKVQCVNLTEYKTENCSLIVLLCHESPLKLRLSKEALQQLAVMVYEAQEEELTHSFFQKVGGDLTSCSLNWKMIYYFQQYHSVTVDFRKSNIKEQNSRELVSVLSRVQFRRLTSTAMLFIIREINETRSAHCVSSLLSSVENCINLNNRELDSVNCAALFFILQQCTAVSLNLLWTSIPEGELQHIVPLLNNVSHLSVDRLLLLRLLHCCSVSELQQGAAAVLFSSLQHKLDFSCRSSVDLTAHTQTHTLFLNFKDCRVISMAIQRVETPTQLILDDCEMEEDGVEQLFTILHKVTLSCSKVLLLKFLARVRVGSESECVRRAVSLSKALRDEVDLSHSQLELQACRSLALFLEHSEGLSELDLSYCHLTDDCLELLLPHLHKSQDLDLSNNDITNYGADRIFWVVMLYSNVQTVRLFNNRITDRRLLESDQRFEIW